MDAIRETALRLTRDRVTDYRTVRASLDGPMLVLPGGEARWAAGAEFAAEDWRDVHAYRDRSGRSYDARDVLGAGGIQASGDRQRWSGFGEVSLPVRDDWDVTLAGRGDDHDDVGATWSHQLASRFRLNDALTLRGSWDKGSRPPSLYELHLRSSNDFPWVCDRRSHGGALETCPVEQVVRVSSGNSNLEPDEAESVSLGAVIGLGSLSLSADWFRIALSDVPARLSPQSIMDLEARGALPPGVAVTRTQEGKVERIDSPIVNSGETDASGVDVRARLDWDIAWADLAIDARWLRMSRQETRVAGELQPGDYPRDRVHGSLRASRGGLTASWSVYAVSGYWNARRTGRFDGWVGHDITARWRDPFGLSGMDLTGGVLNIADRGPSIDPTDPDAADVSLDLGSGAHDLPDRHDVVVREGRADHSVIGWSEAGSGNLLLERNEFDVAFPFAGLSNVVAGLHPQQRIHRHAEHLLDPERHFRREFRPLVEKRGQRRARDPQHPRGPGHRQSHRLDDLALHEPARVGRVLHPHAL